MKKCAFIWVFFIAAFLLGCKKDEDRYVVERGSVTDIDGHVYETVKIGDHWWMAQNLRVSRFNDGSPLEYIPRVDGKDSVWAQSLDPAYCFIDSLLYGFIYNGRVLDSEKNIAPVGWHIPTDEEWMELERVLGMQDDEINEIGWRGKKEANLIASEYNGGWGANDQDEGLYGSDYYGFNAKPSGVRGHDGRTNIQGNSAWWWCGKPSEGEYFFRNIDVYHQEIMRYHVIGNYGMCIRCVKD